MRTITLAATATLILAVAGCSTSDDADSGSNAGSSTSSSSPEGAAGDSEDTAEDQHLDDVEITKQGVEDHDTWGDGAYVVHYTITNSGTGAANYYAGIEFLDADGDVLGNTGITADKLGAGKSKTADASPLPVEIENGDPADIDTAQISEVDRTPVG